MFQEKSDDPFRSKMISIRSQMRKPGRFAAFLKCGLVIFGFFACVYVYQLSRKSEQLKELQNEEEILDIGRINEKLSELVAQGFEEEKLDFGRINEKLSELVARGFNRENREDFERAVKDAKTATEAYELDDGITNEAYEFIKELGLENPGENGDPVNLPKNLSEKIQKRIKEGQDTQGYNAFVSSMVSLNRQLPDVRSDICKNKTYTNLPKCSVIIPFHNEDWMLLMRTVHSVMRNSPLELIEEILLVDDASDHEILQKPLDEYIKRYPLMKVVRSHRRLGIISNRMLGAVNSIGPVMVYLDSHVEVTAGWLEPILDRFTIDMNALVFPRLSSINSNTMQVYLDNRNAGRVGGFNWNMDFKWIDIAWYEGDKPTPMWEPKRSATSVGGAHAMSKDFFIKLGMYDPDFDVWGGEDVELSFKYWLCGGRIEYVPCSFTAHVYKAHKYSWPLAGKGGYRWNTDRIAEVWLDEYIRYYYRMVGDTKGRKFGDIKERIAIRKRNGCKPFKWYLDNVYPKMEIPDDIKDTTAKPELTTQAKTNATG